MNHGVSTSTHCNWAWTRMCSTSVSHCSFGHWDTGTLSMDKDIKVTVAICRSVCGQLAAIRHKLAAMWSLTEHLEHSTAHYTVAIDRMTVCKRSILLKLSHGLARYSGPQQRCTKRLRTHCCRLVRNKNPRRHIYIYLYSTHPKERAGAICSGGKRSWRKTICSSCEDPDATANCRTY